MKNAPIRKDSPPRTAGYPETDIGKDDVRVKGRFMSGTGTKSYGTMRGAGAAVRGKRFLNKYI